MTFVVTGLVCPLVARHTGADVNNQFIIGPIVNAALVIMAVNVRGIKKIIPLVMLPSVFAISLGLILSQSQFMLMIMPAIWLGNLAMVLSFKFFFVHIKSSNPKLHIVNYLVAAIVGVGLKVLIIFAMYSMLVAGGHIPAGPASMLFSIMGVNQLITASAGSMIAFGVVCTQVVFKKHR